MKKSFLLLLMMGIMFACGDDAEEMEPVVDPCDGTEYTYTSNVKSIIDSNCATANCHDGSNARPDYRTYDGIFAFRIQAATRAANGSMPPSGALPDDMVEILQCWVADGGPE